MISELALQQGKIQEMSHKMGSSNMDENSNKNSDSVQLLADFKSVQGSQVLFPPISAQEVKEKKRVGTINREMSKK